MDVYLKDFTRTPVLGQRHTARPIRDRINQQLKLEGQVRIDFSGLEITQSFADELVGALVLEHGPDVVPRLSFAGCSDSVKGIITFVIRDRVHQCLQANSLTGAMQPPPDLISKRRRQYA